MRGCGAPRWSRSEALRCHSGTLGGAGRAIGVSPSASDGGRSTSHQGQHVSLGRSLLRLTCLGKALVLVRLLPGCPFKLNLSNCGSQGGAVQSTVITLRDDGSNQRQASPAKGSRPQRTAPAHTITGLDDYSRDGPLRRPRDGKLLWEEARGGPKCTWGSVKDSRRRVSRV